MKRWNIALAVLVLLVTVGYVKASIVTFDDKVAFLSATGASEVADFHTTASGNRGLGPITVGNVTFTSASGDLWVMDWTARLDDEELAISGWEHVDVTVNLGGEVFAFGFEFVEPEFDPNVNATFVDSTFRVTLLSGATSVDSFTFNAPNDQAAFVGVWSSYDQGFNKVEVRETIGQNENEFFGEFYVGSQPIPEPASMIVWGLLAGLAITVGWWRRRRNAA